MFAKIKNNHLYNFLFRLIVVFIFSSIVWIFLIRSYYEDKIANEINKNISTHKENIVKLLKVDKEKLVDELKTLDKEQSVEFLEFYNKKQELIFSYQKDDSFIQMKSIIKRFGKLSFESFHDLIPYSTEETFLYHQASVKIENKTLYFKLLIKLDDKTRDLIRTDIKETLFIIITTVLIIFISIFPIVYAQYKSMIEKQKELVQSNINTLIALGDAVAKRDSDTSEHNYRVTYYSIKLAQELKLENHQIRSLIKGSFLHDVGKIAISDNILLKPAKLTEKEFETMKTHVLHGVDIVQKTPWLDDAKQIILHHHEKVDGSGYPYGKKQDEIPIEARIFSVVDVFDALTSKRPYKEPFSVEESIKILKKDAGTHFDKEVVESFEKICVNIHLELSNKDNKKLEEIFHETLKPYFY